MQQPLLSNLRQGQAPPSRTVPPSPTRHVTGAASTTPAAAATGPAAAAAARRPPPGRGGVAASAATMRPLPSLSPSGIASLRDISIDVSQELKESELQLRNVKVRSFLVAWRRHVPPLATQRRPQAVPRLLPAACPRARRCRPPLPGQEVSYVSRRRMDAADFDPDEVDEDGLPLVRHRAAPAGMRGGCCARCMGGGGASAVAGRSREL
jgi:hypothetical protein